jgi:hypothetical protein
VVGFVALHQRGGHSCRLAKKLTIVTAINALINLQALELFFFFHHAPLSGSPAGGDDAEIRTD